MINNKLDYKLINIAIIAIIVALIYFTSDFWVYILFMILKIIIPFVIAFAIAHALYPILRNMQRKRIPKSIAIGIIVIVLFGTIGLIIYSILPIIFEQTLSLLSAIINFINTISIQYDLNLGTLQNTLNESFNGIIKTISEYVSEGAVTIINKSFSLISTGFITIFVSIYFLVDMGDIRHKVKLHLHKTNKKMLKHIKIIDYEMSQYFFGLGQFMAWQFVEYTLVYYIIGHPHFLLLAFLAAVTTVIPYLGAILTNVIALITAFAISTNLFILTTIAIILLSVVDTYIVTPKIFGETNKIHPLLTIFAVFAGGIVAGIPGIVIALPITIIIVSTLKFYKFDIYTKIDNKKKL